MPRYQVLHGSHLGDDNLQYDAPAVIESKVDLCKRFNHPGSVKFAKVPDDTPLTGPNAIVPEGAEVKSPDAIFDEMTIEDVRRFAAEKNIKVANTNNKEALVKAIKQAMLQTA